MRRPGQGPGSITPSPPRRWLCAARLVLRAAWSAATRFACRSGGNQLACRSLRQGIPDVHHNDCTHLLDTVSCSFPGIELANNRNLTLVFGVRYAIDTGMSIDNKYIREHSARLHDLFITRRQFLQRAGMGFGALSLAALLGETLGGSTANAIEQAATLTPRAPQFPAKAKHVVHIFAQGAPSHVDTWDPKPALSQYD